LTVEGERQGHLLNSEGLSDVDVGEGLTDGLGDPEVGERDGGQKILRLR